MEEVSHPYKTKRKFMILNNLIFRFIGKRRVDKILLVECSKHFSIFNYNTYESNLKFHRTVRPLADLFILDLFNDVHLSTIGIIQCQIIV